MKLNDLDFYEDGVRELEGLTVVTNAPQTNSAWLSQELATRYDGKLIELDVNRPKLPPIASDKVAILRNAELPLLSGHINAESMFALIQDLRSNVKHLVVCLTISDALVDDYYDTGRQLAMLSMKVLYAAQLIIQLRPLETGRARDITGRLIIARGPRNLSRKVFERELFYFVGPRGSIELNTKR